MQESSSLEEPSLNDYLQPVLRRWWLLAIIVTFGTGLAYWSEKRKPEVFSASTSIIVTQSEADSALAATNTLVLPSSRGVANQAALLRSRVVAVAVQKSLKTAEPPDALRARITVNTSQDTDILSISAIGGDGKSAADLANAYAEAFIASRQRDARSRLFDARRDTGDQLVAIGGEDEEAQRRREELRTRIRQLKAISRTATGGAEQVDAAVPSSVPISPEPRRAAIFGFGLSLLFSYLLALGLERLDRRLRRPDEIAEAYDLPLLAVVPHALEPTPGVDGSLDFAPEVREAFRSLRVNVQLQCLDKPPRLLLVTSALPSEGKSTVSRNLALAYAESGNSVTLVEADLRKPSLAGYLGIDPPAAGLTDVLLGEADLDAVAVELGIASQGAGRFRFVAAGANPSNPPAVLGSVRMREVLARLAGESDVVIVDTPPLLAVSDTLTLLPAVDSFVLVSRVGVTTRDAVKRVGAVLTRVDGVEPLGLIADDVLAGSGSYGYGYGYGEQETGKRRRLPIGSRS